VQGDGVELVCGGNGEDGERIAVVWLCECHAKGTDRRRELQQKREIGLKAMAGIVIEVGGLDLKDLPVVQDAPEKRSRVFVMSSEEQRAVRR
jgi:hypothetical protein